MKSALLALAFGLARSQLYNATTNLIYPRILTLESVFFNRSMTSIFLNTSNYLNASSSGTCILSGDQYVLASC